MQREKTAAIVLSAGSGKRMRSDIPKQYLEIKGKPVIYYSLKAFEDSEVTEIVLVCGAADIEYCRRDIIEKYHFKKVKAVVPGGTERYDSVFEGLKVLEDIDYVLIHDGARPMLTVDMIARSLEAVRSDRACVLAMPVKDTIRVSDADRFAVQTPDRSTLWMVQTPQTFSYELIYGAYAKMDAGRRSGKMLPPITDDAMVAEYAAGQKVRLVEGSYENIKITTPEDLLIAEKFLK